MNRNLSSVVFWTAAFLFLAARSSVAQTAHYRVTFEATWTAETHPQDYPGNAHFSGLVGGTHDATVSFWAEGEPASLGIKRMAEWGSQPDLLAEVQAVIDAGTAGSTLSGLPMWTVPDATSLDFAVDPAYSLVTVVTMIAPSPDWFLGVRNLNLRPGGQWAEEIVVELFPWDAGTDSGVGYASGDQATVPPDPVAPISGAPFTPGVPLGTFTFTRLFVAAVPETPGFVAVAYPNPFNPQTTIAWELPLDGRLVLEIFDPRGRRVRTLLDESAAAGPGQAVWDGRDDAGRRGRSGRYFYRIRLDDFLLTGGLTLVK